MSMWNKKIDWYGGRTQKPLSDMTPADIASIWRRGLLAVMLVVGALWGIGSFMLWWLRR